MSITHIGTTNYNIPNTNTTI